MTAAAALDAGLAALGLDPPAGARERLLRHLDLVREANRTMNMTRILDPEAMVRDHVLDALALLPALAGAGLAVADGATLLDLGPGAGFPGIPLAIVRPDLTVLLAESRVRKAAFLVEAAAALGLGNVAVLALRGSQIAAAEPARAASVQVATARAVADLSSVLRELRDLLAPAGLAVQFKGPKLAAPERHAAARAAARFGYEAVAEIPTVQAGRDRLFVVHRRTAPG